VLLRNSIVKQTECALLTLYIDCVMFSSGPALQGVSGTRRGADGETQAEANPYHIHIGTAQRTGTGVPGDALPRHIHERGDCYEDRFDRGESTGMRKISF